MTDLPDLKLKALVTYPASVIGGTGIETNKKNGNLIVDLAFGEFGEVSAIPTSPTSSVLTYDPQDGSYVRIPSSLLGGAVAGIADAPSNSVLYGRKNATWTPVPLAFGGPSTDKAIARFNLAAGALQNSGVIIDDNNAVSGITKLNITTAFPSSFGSTPTSIISLDVGGFPVADKIPAGVLQGFESSIIIPSSYAQAPWPVTNFSAYVEQNANLVGSSAVPFFSKAVVSSDAPNGSIYHSNGILTNQLVAQANGNNFGAVFGIELDYDIRPLAGGAAPTGSIYGIAFKGTCNTRPTGEIKALDIWPLNSFSNTIPWTHGITFRDGAVIGAALDIGALQASASPSLSQTINIHSRAADGSGRNVTIFSDQNGILRTYDVGGAGKGAICIGSASVALDANAIARFHAAANQNLEVRGNVFLADGIALQSINDANNASLSMEFIASQFRFGTSVFFNLPPSVSPFINGDLVMQLTSNTQLTFKVKGSDGTVRSANLTLA